MSAFDAERYVQDATSPSPPLKGLIQEGMCGSVLCLCLLLQRGGTVRGSPLLRTAMPWRLLVSVMGLRACGWCFPCSNGWWSPCWTAALSLPGCPDCPHQPMCGVRQAVDMIQLVLTNGGYSTEAPTQKYALHFISKPI